MGPNSKDIASPETITKRKDLLKSVENTIRKSQSEGLLGVESSVIVDDPVLVRLRSECSVIKEKIEVEDPSLKSKETVESKLNKLLQDVVDTSERRKQLKDLYNAAYYQILPSQATEVTLSLAVPATNPDSLDISGIGVKEALDESMLPLNSLSQVDSDQVHDLALSFLCKTAVLVIEQAYGEAKVGVATQVMVTKKATLLRDCLCASRESIAKKTNLVNLASTIVKNMLDMQDAWMKGKRVNDAGFKKGLQAQESMIQCISQGNQALQVKTMDEVVLNEIAREAWLWNATAEELAVWQSQASQSSPWEISQGSNPKIDKAQFTYDFLKHRMPITTGLDILFKDKPRSEQRIPSPDEGSFARVYAVKLLAKMKRDLLLANVSGSTVQESWVIDQVAVKVISPYRNDSNEEENLKRTCIRTVREARIWSKMKHVNIVPLLGFWYAFDSIDAPDCLSFISPWMDQGNLSQYLKNNPTVNETQRIKLMVDIAAALSFMHNQRTPVTHGDLKANNVLLKQNRAYLSDFGISNILDNLKGLTTDRHGNFQWQAPEQLFSDPVLGAPLKANIKTDMYSYGSVFFEVLIGRPPWDTNDLGIGRPEIRMMRSQSPGLIPPFPKQITNDSYKALILRCWRSAPTLRPTANMVLHCMKLFLEDLEERTLSDSA